MAISSTSRAGSPGSSEVIEVPFKSSAQRAYLYAEKPEVAKKFAQHSGKQGAALPSKITPPIKGSNK